MENIDIIDHKKLKNKKMINKSQKSVHEKCNVESKPRVGLSGPEQEIVNFIKEITDNIITNSREIIPPKELDIFLPEHNLAIEYNGLMFHSRGISKVPMFNTPTLDKNIHLDKTNSCEAKGIHLLHIFENEWREPKLKSIWQSIIRNKLGAAKNKIGARKLAFATKEQLLKKSKAFIDENHLQGGGAVGPIRYGLVDSSGELLALMTFGKSRFSDADYELIRFAIKKDWSIPGAASRLLKAFERDYPQKKIVSYANRRWSNGNLYKALGFELKHISAPNFYVFKPGNFQLWHRVSFQKHKLKEKLAYFDPNQTAEWNVFQNGYRKIYDSGNYVFIKN